jgi:prepilin-type N-terminal cleavage/methylation domain-containing protein
MKKHYQMNNSKGFTIIEVLVVMAILAIGILAVMTMQITATKSNTNARRITEGGNYLTDEFERLMLLDYDDTIAAYPARGNWNPEPPYTVANAVSAGPINNTIRVDITVGLGPFGEDLNITYYKADPF